MNEKMAIIIATGLALAIMLSWFIYSHYIVSNDMANQNTNGQLKPARRCLIDGDCDAGYSCYNSKRCAPGENGVTECGEQLGDLLCHQKCSQNSDCSEGRDCQEIIIWVLDIAIPDKLCL